MNWVTYLKDPFLVAIDTSILNNIARDYFHEEKCKNSIANDFLDKLYNCSAIPVITWHHIEEMLAHKNDKIAAMSIAFIKELPLLAIVKSDVEIFIGSILDIEANEIRHILKTDASTIDTIIKNTKRDIYKFCSGSEIIEPLVPILGTLRQKVLSKVNKNREIASISRAKTLKTHYKYKLSDIKNMKNYTYSDEATHILLNQMKNDLNSEIKKKGDKKILFVDETTNNFISNIQIKNNYSNKPMIDIIQESSGLTKEEFNKIKSWEDLECVPIFRSRLKTIADKLKDGNREEILKIQEKNCPIWLLWKELYKIRVNAERASGSDINDNLLVGLCLYTDLTIVDKRTHEYLTQIKRKNNLIKKHIGSFEKLSNYVDLLSLLPK